MKLGHSNILARISLLFMGLAFTLLAAELVFRLFPEYKLSQYANKNTIAPMLKSMNRAARDYHIYRPSNILGYELIPNSVVGVNSFGMIGKEHGLSKNKGTYRILVLGDSVTEHNWYVDFLEEKLNNHVLSLKYDFELWNGGVSGYQVDQYAAYLKYKGLRYDPDMLLIGLCLNDFDVLYQVYYKDNNGFTIFYDPNYKLSKYIPLNRFLFKHFYFYRFLASRLGSLLQKSDSKIEGLRYLKEIKDICEKRRISVLCVIFPYMKPFDEYKDFEKKKYREMLDVLNTLNIEFIDLNKFFPDKTRFALRRDKDDYMHPSKEGHVIIAEAIHGYLTKNYFLKNEE